MITSAAENKSRHSFKDSIVFNGYMVIYPDVEPRCMDLLPGTQNCALRMRRERFPRQRLQRKPLGSDPSRHVGRDR